MAGRRDCGSLRIVAVDPVARRALALVVTESWRRRRRVEVEVEGRGRFAAKAAAIGGRDSGRIVRPAPGPHAAAGGQPSARRPRTAESAWTACRMEAKLVRICTARW